MSREVRKTSIGGQAVIEGVMMRGPKKIAVAVRKSDGEIVIDKKPVSSITQKLKFLKLPIIRGVVNFIESMILGVKTLMFSAELYDIEEEPDYKPSKVDAFFEKLFGNKDVVIYTSLVIALVMALGLFMFLPSFITKLVTPYVNSDILKSLIESVIKISIFVLYIIAVSRTKDIQRVFEYHGAEHKTIACYEHGEELTIENVKKHSRFHPRCGTSFLITVMIVSALVFSLVSWDSLAMRILIKLLLLPVVAGVSYEFIKFAGRCDAKIVQMLNKPGLWIQRLTTKEPDESQIEVAIASMKEVIPENEEEAKW